MNNPNETFLALVGMLCVGLALIAWGMGVVNPPASIAFAFMGVCVAYAAVRLIDDINQPRR